MTPMRSRSASTFVLAGLLASAPMSAPSPAPPETDAPARAPLATSSGCPVFPPAAAFVDRIDNRYMPLIPGSIYIYRGSEDGEEQRTVVEVTGETKTILGVEAVVVRDTVTDRRGQPIEITLDWFAQDDRGNVWYLGEDSKEYENGQVVSTEGSWEAGVNGAQPGIVMEAFPRAGDAYSQECAPGVAEDAARVLKLKHAVKTPFGRFSHALLTRETTALEPGVAEEKSYAPCVGLVRAVTVKGGKGVSSLVAVQNAPSRTELGCQQSGKHKPKHKQHRHRHGHGH